ncbi:hypothetical protein D3C85_1221820 [compost metagenome]
MAGIAQHLHRLQVGVEQRTTGRGDVDESRHATRLQHPAHFAQGQAEVAPVVRRIAAEDEIEAGIGKGQALGRATLGAHIAQATLGSGAGDDFEHLLGQVVGHHLAHQWRDVEADVPGATAEVEHPRVATAVDRRLQQRELHALGMHRTTEVGIGLLAELALDHLDMGFLLHLDLQWTPQASRNSQGLLSRCFTSKALIASASCRVRPISSKPLSRQCLRKASTSKPYCLPSGRVTVCAARSTVSW